MNEQIGLYLLGGAESEFLVRAMHGIPGLECDHAAPAEAGEFRAQFRGSQAQGTKIIVRRASAALPACLRRTKDWRG